jgi:Tfp pilus assembly protein FimT
MRANLDRSSTRACHRGEPGFTIIEVTVALFITAEVILAALALFDFHSKLARVQTSISDMQQSLRVAQYDMVRLTRMAGRGSLPAVTQRSPGPQPGQAWGAVSVRNNVAKGADQIAINFTNSPQAVDGTDILTLRGVFTTPIFQLNPAAPSFTFTGGATPATAKAGTVVVCAITPTGIQQDLSALIAAVTVGQPEALILVNPRNEGIYAVVELNPGASNTAAQPQCPGPGNIGVLIAFVVTGDSYANQFQALSATAANAGLPPAMNGVGWLGILEEYRYYVRQDYVVPGNSNTDPAPHLSRARMYPGTEIPYLNQAPNLQADVADNVLDLQVALGVDANRNGQIDENIPPDKFDEWLGNAAGDTLTPAAPLIEVRISTLAKSGNLDWQYQGPLLTNIEDHVYLATDFPNTRRGRSYRHRLLQTVVGLRNM